MLSSHRIPVLTRAHSIVLPEHLPEISDIGEPRVIRDFRYRTVFLAQSETLGDCVKILIFAS